MLADRARCEILIKHATVRSIKGSANSDYYELKGSGSCTIIVMTDVATRETESLDFDLEYDGPALVEHEMDVRDLAPALLSAADLFQVLNRRINPGSRDIQVNIRASRELVSDTTEDPLRRL